MDKIPEIYHRITQDASDAEKEIYLTMLMMAERNPEKYLSRLKCYYNLINNPNIVQGFGNNGNP
jgi:hypothetical protein